MNLIFMLFGCEPGWFVNLNVDLMLLWMFFQLCLPYYHGANNCCKNLSMHSVQIIGAEIVQKKGAQMA